MLRRAWPIGLIAPTVLVVLVTALGVLQYRWVGQVSERERDQLRQSLDRRAREFADDFDREISRAYQSFAPDYGFTPANAERFAKQYEEWQASAPFAGLLKNGYCAEATGDTYTLHRYNPATRQFEKTSWPDALVPVRTRLATLHERQPATVTGVGDVITMTPSPVMPLVPAIVIPETRSMPVAAPRTVISQSGESTFNMKVTVTAGKNYAVLELDKDFMATTMLAALADRHFPESDGNPYRVSVTSGASDVLLSRGLAQGQAIDPKSADAASSFFGLRLEMIRGFVAAPTLVAAGARGNATWTTIRREPDTNTGGVIRMTPVPVPGVAVARERTPERAAAAARSGRPVTVNGAQRGAAPIQGERAYSMIIEQNSTSLEARTAQVRVPATWTLRLQHSAGSLDAAVAQARRRNLFLSFGILSVLAASAMLVMVNARRSEKLAAQQMHFVATVSHELRTPLAVIRSAAQNLSAGVIHDAGQAKRYGDLIESEGRRLTDMVEQVLEYAGLSDAKRRPVSQPIDAASIARDVVTATQSLPEAAGIDIDVNVEADLPLIMADEDAIRRTLHNLIGNALKYGSDGRWVGVTLAKGHGADQGFVLLSVADRGRGISTGDLSHVFEPFYRGRYAIDQQIRGNGLGLSLVKHIVESIGGRVTVTSAPEQGATFTLHVPVATAAPAETV